MASTEFKAAQDAGRLSALSTTQLLNVTTGATSSIFTFTSGKDLIRIPFRLLAEADRLLFRTIPALVVRTTGLEILANRVIALIWGPGPGVAVGAGTLAEGGGAVAQGVAQEAGNSWTNFFTEAVQTSSFKSYWGMLHYLTSRWAFTCFLMALILNRIHVYGSSRQRIFLTWNKRFALRLIPIMLFISQIHQLLQAIRCQTSPYFSLYRHGDNDKYSLLDWSSDGGPMHTLSSMFLRWSDDESACAAVGMSRTEPGVKARFGSFSLLWPTFLRLSVSHIAENLSCALQQSPVMTEVGMSVFEHSLAFAEAETMITHALGIGLFQTVKPSNSTTSAFQNTTSKATIPASGAILAITDAAHALTGPHLFDRVNVPVEVLVVALLSCGNALTSHIISVLGKQRQWRLLNTAFWGVSFMASFVWGFFTTSNMVRNDGGTPRPVSGLLHFPTVAIVGFLPHMAIILGVLVCGCIYLIALLLTAVSLGTNHNLRQPSSLSERVAIAHDNLQAAIQIKGTSIRWYEDFYTALLRVGFASLTAASEAVFLNEGRSVEMRQFTWLEEEHIDEISASRKGHRAGRVNDFQIVEEYGIPASNLGDSSHVGNWQSGYAKERKVEKPKDKESQNKDSFVYPNPRTDGVGALQRTSRFYLLFIFVRGIIFTVGGWISFGIGAFLDRVGITARPSWLRRFVGHSLKQMANERQKLKAATTGETLEFWLVNQDGKLEKPKDDYVDIETEMTKRIALEQHENPDAALDQKLYEWWKIGGWFGTKDESGDYQPSYQSNNEDDDITSVLSVSSTNSEVSDDQWESEPEGAQTPTQEALVPSWSFQHIERQRSLSPADELPFLDNATLARLLDPPDRSSREEARLLASHLGSDGIVTRSRYRQQFERDRAKILLAGRLPHAASLVTASGDSKATGPLNSEEERETLEHLILTRRKHRRRNRSSEKWDSATVTTDDETQAHPTGPPCVICQAEPRTIIAWPCRCLTVCEDCRVSLAMNNFGNCVTCRRSVGGFVRLFVP